MVGILNVLLRLAFPFSLSARGIGRIRRYGHAGGRVFEFHRSRQNLE